MGLERFAASWRESYINDATQRERQGDDGRCVFCSLSELEPSSSSGVVVATPLSFVCLNAFPYGSGHLLVLPRRHLCELSALTEDESTDLFALLRRAAAALERAYSPDGMNVGMNLGRAAGAGLPNHLHAHVLPRWNGDTNFMSTIGETRVLPESLDSTWSKVSAAWSLPDEVQHSQ
jgi:ATP adenylyltransferase